MKRLSIPIVPEDHWRLKIVAAKTQRSMTDIVLRAVEDHVGRLERETREEREEREAA